MKFSDLKEHPEGGRYLEVFRSQKEVIVDQQIRTALTHIYFSLEPDEVSRFHRVSHDEVWNLYSGAGLYLFIWDGKSDLVEKIEISSKTMNFCHVVPADHWQAALPISDRVLVGCSVGPGFEFEDFDLIDQENSNKLQKLDPSFVNLC